MFVWCYWLLYFFMFYTCNSYWIVGLSISFNRACYWHPVTFRRTQKKVNSLPVFQGIVFLVFSRTYIMIHFFYGHDLILGFFGRSKLHINNFDFAHSWALCYYIANKYSKFSNSLCDSGLMLRLYNLFVCLSFHVLTKLIMSLHIVNIYHVYWCFNSGYFTEIACPWTKPEVVAFGVNLHTHHKGITK